MSATGLENFDRTLQKTHGWLNEIGQILDEDKKIQFQAMRAVLWALRDRLTVEEAFHLASHFPTLVRGIYWEGYKPAGKPEKFRTRDEFLLRVDGALDSPGSVDAETASRAVFAAMRQHVSEGELKHVMEMVPEEMRGLF